MVPRARLRCGNGLHKICDQAAWHARCIGTKDVQDVANPRQRCVVATLDEDWRGMLIIKLGNGDTLLVRATIVMIDTSHYNPH